MRIPYFRPSRQQVYAAAAAGRYAAFMLATLMYVFYLYTQAGLSPDLIKLTLMITAVSGALLAPLIGWISDSCLNTRKSYLSWILGGSIAGSACLIMMFAEPTLPEAARVIYTIVVSLLWIATFALSDIPFWSLLSFCKARNALREQMTAHARAIGTLACGILFTTVAMLLHRYDVAESPSFYVYLALTVAAVLLLGAVALFYGFGEVPPPVLLSVADFNRALFKNDQLLATGFITFLQQSALTVLAVAMGAVIWSLPNTFELIWDFFFPAVFATVAAFVTYRRACETLTRRGVFVISCALMIAGFSLLMLTDFRDPSLLGGVIASFMLANVGTGWSIASTTVMTADCVEYGEFKLRRRAPGAAFAIQTFCRCAAPAIALILTEFGDLFGGIFFNSHGTSHLLTVFRISVIACVAMIAAMLVCYLLCFRLHGKVFENILVYLEDGRGSGGGDASQLSRHPLRYALNPGAVFCRLHADTPEQVMDILASRLASLRAVKTLDAYKAEVARKIALSPAGIAEGIAIPHAVGDFAARPAIAIATLKKPLDFKAADGRKCDLVFMIAVPDDPDLYITLLGQLSLMLNAKGFGDKLRHASGSDEILDRIIQCEKHLF